jgi:hypothetical protein
MGHVLGLLQILEGQHRAACGMCGHIDDDGSTAGCREPDSNEPPEPHVPQAPAPREPAVVSRRSRTARWTRCFGV